jgi:hypothetical protein
MNTKRIVEILDRPKFVMRKTCGCQGQHQVVVDKVLVTCPCVLGGDK